MKKLNNFFLFWDLDGTIVDSEPDALKIQIFETALRQIGSSVVLTAEQVRGRDAKDIFLVAFPDANQDWANNAIYLSWFETVVSLSKQQINQTVLKPGVQETWDVLRSLSCNLAVVTSNTREVATLHLQRHQIAPDFIIGREDVLDTKPHPAPYLLALQKTGFSPEKCLVIEDSAHGVCAAKAAGLRVIGVNPLALVFDQHVPTYYTDKISSDLIIKILNS